MIAPYTYDALRTVLARHALTGSAAARLLGVDSRTVRRWTAPPEQPGARPMPIASWWLLLILTGETTVPELLNHIGIAP